MLRNPAEEALTLWFDASLLKQALHDSLVCVLCGDRLVEVWLTSLATEPEEHGWAMHFPSQRAPLCETCASAFVHESWWWPRTPCGACGRAVHRMRPRVATSWQTIVLDQPAREQAYCSARCRSTAAKRRQRGR